MLFDQNQLPHTWVNHTYKPSSTFCDQCGTIMYGLQNQGFKCDGSYNNQVNVAHMCLFKRTVRICVSSFAICQLKCVDKSR